MPSRASEGRDSRNRDHPAKIMPRPGPSALPSPRATSRRNPVGSKHRDVPAMPAIHRTFLRTYATVAERVQVPRMISRETIRVSTPGACVWSCDEVYRPKRSSP